MNNEYPKNFGKYVTVYSHDGKLEISWGSIGSVSANQAQKFMDELQQAIDHVEKN